MPQRWSARPPARSQARRVCCRRHAAACPKRTGASACVPIMMMMSVMCACACVPYSFFDVHRHLLPTPTRVSLLLACRLTTRVVNGQLVIVGSRAFNKTGPGSVDVANDPFVASGVLALSVGDTSGLDAMTYHAGGLRVFIIGTGWMPLPHLTGDSTFDNGKVHLTPAAAA